VQYRHEICLFLLSLYLASQGKPDAASDNKPWERVIADDFAEFRKAGLKHPIMADIEKKLGIAHK